MTQVFDEKQQIPVTDTIWLVRGNIWEADIFDFTNNDYTKIPVVSLTTGGRTGFQPGIYFEPRLLPWRDQPPQPKTQRTIDFPLLLLGRSRNEVDDQISMLERFFIDAEKASGVNGIGELVTLWVRFGDADNFTVFDILNGTLDNADLGEIELGNNLTGVVVRLQALPYARGEPHWSQTFTVTQSNPTIYLPNITGNQTALCRLIVEDDSSAGGVALNLLTVGRRSLRSLDPSDVSLYISASGSTTAVGGAWTILGQILRPSGKHQNGVFDLFAWVVDNAFVTNAPTNFIVKPLQSGGGLIPDIYTYLLTSVDAVGNESEPSPVVVVTVDSAGVLFQDDFEDNSPQLGPFFRGADSTASGEFPAFLSIATAAEIEFGAPGLPTGYGYPGLASVVNGAKALIMQVQGQETQSSAGTFNNSTNAWLEYDLDPSIPNILNYIGMHFRFGWDIHGDPPSESTPGMVTLRFFSILLNDETPTSEGTEIACDYDFIREILTFGSQIITINRGTFVNIEITADGTNIQLQASGITLATIPSKLLIRAVRFAGVCKAKTATNPSSVSGIGAVVFDDLYFYGQPWTTGIGSQGPSNVLTWNPDIENASQNLYIQRNGRPWRVVSLASSVNAYTHIDSDIGAIVNDPTKPSFGPPAATNSQLRAVSLVSGVGLQGEVGAPTSTRLANGKNELVYLGTFSLPPVARQWDATDEIPWYVRIDTKAGGSVSQPTVQLLGLFRIPHDDESTLVVENQGLVDRRTWQIDGRPDGVVSAQLGDASGVVYDAAHISSAPFTLFPGSNVLIFMPEYNNGLGQLIVSPNWSMRVQIRWVPRFKSLRGRV